MDLPVAGGVIRQGEPGDLEAIEALENDLFEGDRLSRRSLRYFLKTPTAAVLVVPAASGLDAYGLIAFRVNSRIARLYSLAVSRAASGRGLGRRLLATCEDVAARRGCGTMRLEVRTDNAAAIRLYQAMGYVRTGSEADYYEDGATALRFAKPLRPAAAPAPRRPAPRQSIM